ncbi:MAG: ABC transporter [Sphingomonas sp. 28-66-16]|nr:MAG: ABC transporter [Sphingomonas sp. 28-66-16]
MRSVVRAFEAALLEILGARALLSLAIVSVLFYAFYYPAPYAQQQAQTLAIVAVDQDRTPLSRAVVRALGNTNAVRITEQAPDMMAARQAVRQRRADGIILLSKGLAAEVLDGRPGSGIAVIVNGAYFVRAEAIGRAVAEVAADQAARLGGRLGLPAGLDPAKLIVLQPLFNTTQGYRDYVFPAIINIILQQTLLFAAARLIAERRRRGVWRGGIAEALGSWAALTVIGIAAGAFVFGYAFWLQDVPRAGNGPGLLIALPLFAAAVAALGLSIGSLFDNGDDALKLLMPTSVPLVFLAGFAWPLDEMPPWLAALAWLSPSTAAMHLLVRFNQMGASIAEAIGPLAVMAGLAGGYGLLWCQRNRALVGRRD